MWSVTVTTSNNFGMTLGALTSGFLMGRFNKWTLIVAMDLAILLGSACSLVDDMVMISLGRFISGYAIGGLTVYCPQFTNEICPTEYKGPIGSMTQFWNGFGIFTTGLFGLAIPDKEALKDVSNQFYVQHYWRVVWSVPILIAGL